MLRIVILRLSSKDSAEHIHMGKMFCVEVQLSSQKVICSVFCQVRLNFEEVELLDPDATGACRTDYMQVTGGVGQVSRVHHRHCSHRSESSGILITSTSTITT